MPLENDLIEDVRRLNAWHVKPALDLRDAAIDSLFDLVFRKRRVHKQVRRYIQPQRELLGQKRSLNAAGLVLAKCAQLSADALDSFGYLVGVSRRGTLIQQVTDQGGQPSLIVLLEP